jgi:Protein of unknown function (DUF3386)
MKLHVWTASLVWLAGTGLQAADTKPTPTKGDPRAAALMQEAAKTRYTWSPDVSAVSGKIAWEKDGRAGAGTFRSVLRQRGGLSITADGDEQVPTDVKDHVASMINHRVPPAPGSAERSQPHFVIVVEDEERGPLILTVGDPMQSTQRVKDSKLVQVNRVMAGKRFTIDVTEFEKAPDGQRVYPAAFIVTWWDAATGKKVEKQSYSTQGFHLVDGQMFPKAEKVVSEKDGKKSTLEIKYYEIKFETTQQRGPTGVGKSGR